ncbi:DUF7555 family protein [Halogeometricum borinquense]|uniref:DUF7555 family protein n=1 Tax=Halogeometricum borinquense TaxID=60847 RepID=UPI0034312FF1
MDLDSDTIDSRPRDDTEPDDGMPLVGQLLRTLLDAATWGVVFLLGGSVVLGLIGLVIGNGLVGFKRGLFIFGFLAMGGSLLMLRPKRAWKRGRDEDAPGAPTDVPDGAPENDHVTDGDSGPVTLLPDSLAPNPVHRSSWGLRVFFGGIWALVASYLMETVFGVVPV